MFRPKQKICLFPVTCPNTKVRVGRSFFKSFVVVVARRDFAQKMVKNVKTVFFRWFLLKKYKKLLGSGPFYRNGRVTGNKHISFVGLIYLISSHQYRSTIYCRKTYIINPKLYIKPGLRGKYNITCMSDIVQNKKYHICIMYVYTLLFEKDVLILTLICQCIYIKTY